MLIVKFFPNEKGNPPGKLADAELHFDGALAQLVGDTTHEADALRLADSCAALDGLKLCGFAIWERRTGTVRSVTFPARAFSVNGERRSYALLRPSSATAGADAATAPMRDFILAAYAEFEAEQAVSV